MANSMTKDLRKKTNEELTVLVVKLKEQLLQIRFSIANGEAEKLHNVNKIKKTIARILTILNERSAKIEINNIKPKPEVKKAEPKEVKKAEPKVEKVKETPKPKLVNGISTDKKHVVVKMDSLDAYDYDKRRKSWKQNAGYNEEESKCCKCKTKNNKTSILLEDKTHICYTCWIKKELFNTLKDKGAIK